MYRFLVFLVFLPSFGFATTDPFCEQQTGVAVIANPVMFVTQFPLVADFGNIVSTFQNHEAGVTSAPRGGDVYIRYPDGELCNVTQEAGLGSATFQGGQSIAVRDPAVDFSGTKAVFSMAMGGADQRFQVVNSKWQLYEVTGLAKGQPVVITKVPNQPDFNNIQPSYLSDGRIVFVSDRPRNGQLHLYPQLDEYENQPVVSGLWSLNSATGELLLLDHSPSGSFSPEVDSFGRIIFTRWDHLQRDQQADGDALGIRMFGTFDYSDESPSATRTANRVELFPEPRADRVDLLAGTNIVGLRFNHFFPWEINQDGSEIETLNHVGRHELHAFFTRSINDDANVLDFIAASSGRVNANSRENYFHMREFPDQPGVFIAVDAPEFTSHASGQLITLNGAPTVNPDLMAVTDVTHPDTGASLPVPTPDHSGHYRDPLPMSNGTLLAAHTFQTGAAGNLGSGTNPSPRYRFRIRELGLAANGFMESGAPLTNGIRKDITYFNPDQLVTYSDDLWELYPVEIYSRAVPEDTKMPPLSPPEQNAFDLAGVPEERVRDFLWKNGLALMVVRNVTSRDDADSQQPYNLRIPDGGVESISTSGTVYDVNYMQFFQADQVRGQGGVDSPEPGRRPLARTLHDPRVLGFNPTASPTSPGAFHIGQDGSLAVFLPAQRAMSWQLLAPDGTPIIRERYWITFQPGEIRVCDGCHGVNTVNHTGQPAATNTPQVLTEVLQQWDSIAPLFSSSFEIAPPPQ